MAHHSDMSMEPPSESPKLDVDALVEIRARQRTFNGAYARSALGNLGYSLTVLRLFQREFFRIGLLYAVLAALLFACAYLRERHSQRSLNEGEEEEDEGSPLRRGRHVVQTKGHEHKAPVGPPFVTAGWVVISVAGIVAVTEIVLLALILEV
ncbi:hypothetical protein OF83DRAFT_1174351 [Amylostereum chailletii]|nr:hypothetical protein OF83DRAFT_1174351 [Amylostereum chailletii]